MVPKARTKARNVLMTDEDMELAYRHYLETYFSHLDDSAEELFDLLKERLGSDDDGECNLIENDGEEIGVTRFAKLPEAELDRLLGLTNSVFPFGETGEAGDPDKPQMRLRWHQKVLVATALERIFTKAGEAPTPTYLCDDVGMGKTAMMVGLISQLAHIVECQRQKKPLPPLLTGK